MTVCRALTLLWLGCCAAAGHAAPLQIGSKAFTESVILGEILTQLARAGGAQARHRRALGGTRVLWDALLAGEIDAYPEYTGTLTREILAGEAIADEAALRQALAARGLRMSASLGFNNGYALGVQEGLARSLGLRRISDLRGHPELKLGFGNEFMDRTDGWPGLRARYRLPHQDVRGLDHDLAYRGLASGHLQVTDLYTTDAEIAYYGLRILEDDLGYFPRYEAVILYREPLAARAPEVVELFEGLAGRIDAPTMIAMNAQVKLEGATEARVASAFLGRALGVQAEPTAPSTWQRLARHTREHLSLVGLSLGAAIAIAIPLGILAARRPRAGQLILGLAGILQTIPSLALFVFLIPLLGIGAPPAVAALFLYSLLPIVRNTYTGLRDIAPPIRESAEVLGLSGWARLRVIELPLSARAILAGIKTSAVINVGTATLGALIGAGGYGQPILTGIRLDDMGLILQGAVPAALLALLVQGGFDLAERWAVPRGLRGDGRRPQA